MSSYTATNTDPAPGTVAAMTVVAVLPDGSLGALVDDEGYVSLIHAPVLDGEDWLLEATLRIPVSAAGFRPQRVHVVATENEPDAVHLITWMAGDLREDLRPSTGPQLQRFSADQLRNRLDSSGLVPGGVSGAWIVADVAASLAADTEEARAADLLRHLTPAYLAADTPQGGSGFSGDAEQWEQRRGHIADAIPRDGTFLDLGCANGFLMESVQRWCAQRGVDVVPYGVDISAELVAEAKRRLPHWADRLAVGDALTWRPADARGLGEGTSEPAWEAERFDVVHALLDCVPAGRRAELVAHARTLVAPGGRLLVSLYTRSTGTEPHVVEALAALDLPQPDGVAHERGTQWPVSAWYDVAGSD